MRSRLYVSIDAKGRGEIIRRQAPPKDRSELPAGGVYAIGPFHTRAGAEVCASGRHAPGIQCVSQFERVAKLRMRGEKV